MLFSSIVKETVFTVRKVGIYDEREFQTHRKKNSRSKKATSNDPSRTGGVNWYFGFLYQLYRNRKKTGKLESLIRISNALGITVDELLSGNQIHNPTDYQTDIDLLMEDCSLLERRFIYELISVAKYIIRNNGWELIEQKRIAKTMTRG